MTDMSGGSGSHKHGCASCGETLYGAVRHCPFCGARQVGKGSPQSADTPVLSDVGERPLTRWDTRSEETVRSLAAAMSTAYPGKASAPTRPSAVPALHATPEVPPHRPTVQQPRPGLNQAAPTKDGPAKTHTILEVPPTQESPLPEPPLPPWKPRLSVVVFVVVAIAGATYMVLRSRQEPAHSAPLAKVTAAPPPKPKPKPKPKPSDAIAKSVAEARECLRAEKYVCALTLSKRILLTDPGNDRAKAIRDEAERIQGEARAAVDRCMSLKDADCAQSALAKLRRIDPSTDEIQAYEKAIARFRAPKQTALPSYAVSTPSRLSTPEPAPSIRPESSPTVGSAAATTQSGPSPQLIQGLKAAQNDFSMGQWDKAIGEAQGVARFAISPQDSEVKRQAEELIRRSQAEQKRAIAETFGGIR